MKTRTEFGIFETPESETKISIVKNESFPTIQFWINYTHLNWLLEVEVLRCCSYKLMQELIPGNVILFNS